METIVTEIQSNATAKKSPNKVWLILGILINISIVAIVLLMDLTIANLVDGYGLMYGDSPIGLLKFLFILLVLINLGLHFLHSNFSNWIMVPILFFMSYKFYRMLSPLSDEISESQNSGYFGIEADIAAENFSSFEDLSLYLLLAGISYIVAIVVKSNKMNHEK